MKKFNFLTTTLILSLITGAGLVACGETSTPTTEAPTSIVETPDRVHIDNPTDIIVGQTVNLDDYVEVIGVSNDNAFDAELLTPETATLEGHTVTVIKEGDVRVKIRAHNYHKDAKVEFTAISELRAAFKEKMTITNQYFLEDINVSQTGQLSLSGQGIVHNPKYFATPNQSGKYDGMLETKSGNTYQFSCDDLAGTNLDVASGVQEQFDLYYLSMPFSLSYMDLETVYDEKTGEPIYLSTTDDTTIKNYCNRSSGLIGPSEYPARLMEKYPDQYTSIELVSQELVVEFLPTDEAGTLENSLVSILVYFELSILPVGQTEPVLDGGYMTYAVAHTDTSLGTIAGVDAYIASGEEPVALECDSLIEKLTQAATLRNYTQQTQYFWSNQIGNPNAQVADPTQWGLPNDTLVQAVTEETIFTQQETEAGKVQSFYTVRDGQLYYGDNYAYDENGEVVEDENGNPTLSDSFMVEEVKDVTSIWDDPLYSTLTLKAFADGSIFDSVTIAGVQKGEGYEVFDLGRPQEFAAAIMSSAVGYGPQMNQIFAANGFYEYTYVQAVVTEQYVQVVLALALSGGYYYNVVSTFLNIGTTQAPNLDGLFQ